MSAQKSMVIGKIPSYNSNLKPLKSIDYENRLLNNLTITEFTPVGYSINLSDFQSIYRIGKDLKYDKTILGSIPGLGDNTDISLYTALSQWTTMQTVSGIANPCESFKIISTNDSTINETLSNQYKNNVLDDVGSWAGGGLLGAAFSGIKDTVAGMFGSVGPSMDTSAALNVLSNLQKIGSNVPGMGDSQYAGLLLGKMIGIQAAFPKIWSTSDYNNTSSFTIKLVSPDGNPVNVDNFVLKPLRTLILSASPITFDGISYGYPPLWSVYAKGMVSMKLAAITAITISRGGQDTLFNRYNQPTNIDVRITVEPVIQGFATPMLDNISDQADKSTGNVKMIVQNPSSIISPMEHNATDKTYSDIMLQPLILN